MSAIFHAAATAVIILLALAGCSALEVEGGCTYTRQITTTYICPIDGHLQHHRLAPWNPEF